MAGQFGKPKLPPRDMRQMLNADKVYKYFVLLGDLCLLNLVFISLYGYENNLFAEVAPFPDSMRSSLYLFNLVHLISFYLFPPILQGRKVRPDHIVLRTMRCIACHTFITLSVTTLLDLSALSVHFYLTFYSLFFLVLVAYRLVLRYLLKQYRRKGGNTRSVVLLGCNPNMVELHRELAGDSTTGFRVIGYFNDTDTAQFYTPVPYLGRPLDVINYLQQKPVDQVYCCLPSAQSEVILPIINYCENHMIRFYSVPNVHSYLHRRMYFEMLGNVPVLSIRREPLSFIENRLLKRTFDILFSLAFLCTLFPIIYVIVGIAIKCSSPGPIFFKQKRSGKNGREFYCYKFRSMRVNAESDTLQATASDPRKTRLGEFLRHTNLDELPQFINVLLGDMSVVGPRPHMLKHTEEYSRLIDKYMVRHLVRPGVTGWAQVTGFRGETRELWQMEGRVQRDVWYLEHWTFLLDLYIIYKTVANVIKGEKEAC